MKIAEISEPQSHKMANMSLIAAVFVVMMHVGPVSETGHFWFDWSLSMLKNGFCQAAMPWFFFAAGYFLVNHYGRDGWYLNCLRKRFHSLVIPFLFWGAIYVLYAYVLMLLGSNYQWPYHSWYHLVSKTYGITYQLPAAGHLWFMRNLCGLVVISPILIYLLGKAPRVLLTLTFLLAWVSPALCRWADLPKDFFYSGIPLEGLPCFLLGMYLRFCRRDLTNAGCPWVWLVISFGLLTACHLANLPFLRWPGLLASALGVWGLVPANVWPCWLTASSFPIYLVHWLFLSVLSIVYKRLGIPSFFDVSVIGYLAQVMIVFCLSLLATLLIRLSLRRFSSWLFGGR